MNRRRFMKNVALSGFALYGCSKTGDSIFNPSNSDPLPPSAVALVKTSNRIAGITQALGLLSIPTMQDKHVIVKPNWNTADPFPASTHNDTLAQIVQEIRDRGAADVTVAERPYQDFREVVYLKGLKTLASDLGFSIVNLQNEPMTPFSRSGLHWSQGFSVPNLVLEADYIVSTCCLKTHAFGGRFTMSLKLSVGVLPEEHMTELHASPNMRKMIAEINLAYRPEVIVMDAIEAFIDGGPSNGTLATGNAIIAGTDRIAVDAVGVAILKELGSQRVNGPIFEQDQIQRAVQLDLGIRNATQITFLTSDQTSQNYADTLKTILESG